MQYGIVVDSGCDLKFLSGEAADKIDFTRAPLTLDIGNQTFVDDHNLDIEKFMKEMYAFKGKTGSAAPSPQAWLSAYEKSDYVFAISITSALSGSYASARTGMHICNEQYPDKKVHLIDSKSAGPGLTILVEKLIHYINEGLDFETICKLIDEYRQKTHLLFVLKSLENLVKSGRVSKLQGKMAGLLNIKILGTASAEGNFELLQKCRGKLLVYDKCIEEILARGYKGGRLIISHCFARETAEYVANVIKSKFSNCSIDIMPTGGLCSYYAEDGGILIGFES